MFLSRGLNYYTAQIILVHLTADIQEASEMASKVGGCLKIHFISSQILNVC